MCRSRRSYDSCDARPVRSNFLRMQPQGNQNTHVCLEEKRRCAGTEQRKQLARKVPDQLDGNATQTHRDRLYPARACETVKGSFGSAKNQREPFRLIAARVLGTSGPSGAVGLRLICRGRRHRSTIAQKPKTLSVSSPKDNHAARSLCGSGNSKTALAPSFMRTIARLFLLLRSCGWSSQASGKVRGGIVHWPTIASIWSFHA